jgi:REP element-mobilizing transposase RayT
MSAKVPSQQTRRRPATQLGLALPPGRGGYRKNAGRHPKAGGRAGVSHHGRDEVTGREPVHVTLRCLGHVWNLRSRRAFDVIAPAIARAQRGDEFSVAHFSAQGNHLHLLVEARDGRALSEGVQGLSVRLAKGLNRLMGRHGRVFSDRHHAHVLRTPTEVRRALAYVLLNRRSHLARVGEAAAGGPLDPYSSAPAFDGWAPSVDAPRPHPPAPAVVVEARTWLLRAGWRRRGLLSPDEVPAAP